MKEDINSLDINKTKNEEYNLEILKCNGKNKDKDKAISGINEIINNKGFKTLLN